MHDPSLVPLRAFVVEILAYAVCELFPQASLLEADISDVGFHYDFMIPQQIPESMLPLIEEKMRSLLKEKLDIRFMEMVPHNAATLLKHHGQHLKAEHIEQIPDAVVPIIQINHFYDLALSNTVPTDWKVALKLFSLEKLEGDVYRIVGSVFPDMKALKTYTKTWKLAKENDHQKLGEKMGLFKKIEIDGKEEWLWLPKGAKLKQILLNWWWKRVEKEGVIPACSSYETFYTPFDFQAQVYQTVFSQNEVVKFGEWGPKHLNCPESHLVGLLKAHHYLSEQSSLFCSPSHLQSECISSLQFIQKTINIFELKHQWVLYKCRPPFIGMDRLWNQYTEEIAKALDLANISYRVKTDHDVHQRIYPKGPKVEVQLADAYGKMWSASKWEVDFHFLRKTAAQKKPQTLMIRRSLLGSLERWIAILIESKEGYLPFFIAPEQVRIIPLKTKNIAYAEKVEAECRKHQIRVNIDQRTIKLGDKVYAAAQEKIPCLVMIGDDEEKHKQITVRSPLFKKENETLSYDQFFERLRILNKEIEGPLEN